MSRETKTTKDDPPDKLVWIAVLGLFVLSILICLKKPLKEYEIREQSVVYQWEVPVLQFRTLGSLIGCIVKEESGGDPYAYNPRDPTTESIGLFQFKRETFNHFCVKNYGLPNTIWSPDVQERCCRIMLSEGYGEHWSTFNKCKHY